MSSKANVDTSCNTASLPPDLAEEVTERDWWEKELRSRD